MLSKIDFKIIFDVTNGNPNGDPDSDGRPRVDQETNHGLISDVCIKRKIRNYIELKNEHNLFSKNECNDIFIKNGSVLNQKIEEAYKYLNIDLEKPPANEKKRKTPGKAQGQEINDGKKRMLEKYSDIRTFGAVLTTGANAGQVKGPVQITYARSIDPVFVSEDTITRCAVTTDAESEANSGLNQTMGRKYTIPYALYVSSGFISAPLAQKTGFSQKDLDLLFESILNMFEHERSASRGEMTIRKLIVFKHRDLLGNAHASNLFSLINIKKKTGINIPRCYNDYDVIINREQIPENVTLIEML